MSEMMEFYTKDDAASEQIGKNVYRRVSIPIDDFNAACDHYGFVLERTCKRITLGLEREREIATVSWICSACRKHINKDHNYCHNCGARVIGEWES